MFYLWEETHEHMKDIINKLTCYFKGHIWGKKLCGWQMNPDWDIDRDRFNIPDPKNPMTLPWRHCRCERCDIIVDWHWRHDYKTQGK